MENAPSSSLERKILHRLRRWGRGCVFSNRDFFALGADSSIAWALYRLKNQGKIRMLHRGLYDYPEFSRALQENLAPDMHSVAQALARKFRWNIQPSGSAALQHFGLSTQVPLRTRYYSDGPNRSYVIEGRTLEFCHIPRKEAALPSPECELYIQAVKELGENSLQPTYLPKLRALLTEALRTRLNVALPLLAERERKIIRTILTSENE